MWYYLTHSWEDKGVHTFPKGICPKVNVKAQLEYELAYYDPAVHRFKPLHHEDTPWLYIRESPNGIAANVLDCNIIVSEFDLQLY